MGTPIQGHWCPYKEMAVGSQRHAGEPRVKVEAETGVPLPQARGHLGPPEAGRGEGVGT